MKYIIQSQQNQNYCIGVTQAGPHQPVVLSFLQGAGSPLTQWHMDPNTGIISLVADPQLVLDVQGTGGQGSQLILSHYVLGRASQAWNWLGNPPLISNNAYPSMVVDNSGANVSPGNPVLLWGQNNQQNQRWTQLSVPDVEGFLARTKAEPAGTRVAPTARA
ncbi:MAG TPA: RICIN domain-containing protein [Kofleriaceae bacterium]|nr:RICIN domain-containing protein [Kofleriaceae bacterium]